MPSDAPAHSASGPSIAVTVQNTHGEEITLEVEADCTVYGLKCRVAEAWQVPPCCQRLTHPSQEKLLQDEKATLAEQEPTDDKLTLAMAVSSDDVFKCLENEDCAIRRMAVQTLGQVAHKDFGKAMSALGNCLHDPEWEVRRAAVELLGQVAPRGDEGAIGAALAHFQDRSVSVKQASVLALAQLVKPPNQGGDIRIIDVIIPMLEDRDDGVRRAVAEVLHEMVGRGNKEVVEAVTALLSHWSVLVQRAAIETLAYVGEKGDAQLIEKIGSFLVQEPGLVRVAAVLSIGQLTQGEKDTVGMVLSALEDPDERVQAAAAFVLREAGLADSMGGDILGDMRLDKAPQDMDRCGLREGPGETKAVMRRTASA